MRILYVSHKPIYPKTDGGCVAMANFLELLLSSNNEVKHLTISTNKHPFDSASYPKAIVDATHLEAVYINTDVKPLKALFALFKSNSYNVSRFYSEEMNAKLITTLKDNSFDVIILESLFSTACLASIRANFKGKVYIRSHNVEHQIWEDLALNCRNWLKRSYFKKLANDLKHFELETIAQVDGTMTISEDDAEFFRKNTSSVLIKTIPFTVELDEQLTNDYSASNIFLLGGMDWEPNKLAAKRLIGLFPLLKEQKSEIELTLIGKGTKKLNTNNTSIHLQGFVTDLPQFCVSAGILACPLTSGSGIRIKILEMMALGIPVITTSKGAQGIHYNGKNCILIANSDEEIIEACIKLSSDAKLRKEIGTNARKSIATYHSPSIVSQQLNEFLQFK